MKNSFPAAIELERAGEQIRQERETFDHQKSHSERWFTLRLTMGYTSIALLAGVMGISGYVLLNAEFFQPSVVALAGGALFVDVLGLLAGIWRIAMNPKLISQLEPVTNNHKRRKGRELKTGAKEASAKLPASGNPMSIRASEYSTEKA